MSEQKLPFCSQTWVDHARSYLEEASANADLEGIRVSFNEVFTDAPSDLDPDSDGRVGWYLRVQDGKLEVDRGILEFADLRITADYVTTLPLARLVFSGSPDSARAAGRLVAEATAAGKMRREGDEAVLATLPWLVKLHDVLAERTA